jgi:hypothetical protein
LPHKAPPGGFVNEAEPKQPSSGPDVITSPALL